MVTILSSTYSDNGSLYRYDLVFYGISLILGDFYFNSRFVCRLFSFLEFFLLGVSTELDVVASFSEMVDTVIFDDLGKFPIQASSLSSVVRFDLSFTRRRQGYLDSRQIDHELFLMYANIIAE
ncbi:uncharacterized protein [Euphorbia lathyris]|uniref:uncharacterized protein isoform X1 n=1 Tax=Euphorbia lathyris TaxID=212925 RepID=UPI003313D73D